MSKKIDKIIETESYEGIRDMDGWETLELTVRDDYPEEADAILKRLEDEGIAKVAEQQGVPGYC